MYKIETCGNYRLAAAETAVGQAFYLAGMDELQYGAVRRFC